MDTRGAFELPDPALMDAGRRMHEDITLHMLADKERAVGSYVAFDLADGSSDRTMYDTFADCLRHQRPYEENRCYIRIAPDGMSQKVCSDYLAMVRKFVSMGMKPYDLPVVMRGVGKGPKQ